MRKLFITLIIALIAIPTIWGNDVRFTANAPRTVVVGEQFYVKFAINADAKEFQAPSFAGLEVLFGPSQSSSSSINIVNGNMTRSYVITYTYVVMAPKEGEYTIEGASVRSDKSTYKATAVTVKALPANQTASQHAGANSAQQGTAAGGNGVSNDAAFVKMFLSKTTPYEQEGVLATFKLYTKYNCGLSNAKFPEFEGFLVHEVDLPDQKQWSVESYNGVNYKTVVLHQVVLYPQRAGKLKISRGRFDATVRLQNTSSDPSNIFDSFFSTYRDVNKTLTTPEVSLNVKPLPQNKPASFNGAVGRFKLSSECTPTSVKTDESITLKVKLSGSGNVKLLKNPTVDFPNDFEVYDPKVDSKINVTAAGASGSKTIEYYAVPRYAGSFTVPSVQFSYFDVAAGKYKTLKSKPYTIVVEKGEGSADPTRISNYTNKEEVRSLGDDVRYLKVGAYRSLSAEPFFGSISFTLALAVPFVLFIFLVILFRKQIKERADLSLRRNKQANRVAKRRLRVAEKVLKANQRDLFYEELHKALWGYLGDKLLIPTADLTRDTIVARLADKGASDDVTAEVVAILDSCEFARYAPSTDQNSPAELYRRSTALIGTLESLIG